MAWLRGDDGAGSSWRNESCRPARPEADRSQAGSRSPQPVSWLQFWPLVTSPFCITSLPFSRPHGLVEILVSAGSQILPQFLHRLALWVPGGLSVGSRSSWSLPWERRGVRVMNRGLGRHRPGSKAACWVVDEFMENISLLMSRKSQSVLWLELTRHVISLSWTEPSQLTKCC